MTDEELFQELKGAVLGELRDAILHIDQARALIERNRHYVRNLDGTYGGKGIGYPSAMLSSVDLGTQRDRAASALLSLEHMV